MKEILLTSSKIDKSKISIDELPLIVVKNEKDWSRALSEAYYKGCRVVFPEVAADENSIMITEYLCSPEIHSSV